MAHRLTAPRVCVLVLLLMCVACALPPATPPAAEIDELRGRVARSRSDEESVIRLAAGLWAEGDREGSRQVLREASAAVPEAAAYTVALGATTEASGEYYAARALYLDFLDGAAASALALHVGERVQAMRGETAAPLVRELVDSDLPLAHGMDPQLVVALLPFDAPETDPDLTHLAAVATELVTIELRSNDPFYVLDWEVSEAARRALIPSGQGDARAVGELLGAQRVVSGRVGRAGPDSVVFVVEAWQVENGGNVTIAEDSIRTALGSFAEEHMRITSRVWEMLVGARPGSLPADYLEAPTVAPTAALMDIGEGLLAGHAGDRAGARERFERARLLAPDFRPLLDRIDQVEALDALQSSQTLPLAEEILDVVRRQAAAASLLRESTSAGLLDEGSTRHGVSEAFGLDRLGSQVFIDFVIDFGGSGP